MITPIDQVVRVRAEFTGGQLRPLFFFWQNREYQVQGVDFVHNKRSGSGLIYFFSLTGPAARYYLSFNAQTFIWRLLSVES